jgi:hypothetical protein
MIFEDNGESPRILSRKETRTKTDAVVVRWDFLSPSREVGDGRYLDHSKPAPDAGKPKGTRKPTKKAKPAKRASRAKKPAGKPKAERTNKKAEVIEMMKRAKGATLAEIMKATGWQPHTVRGFVSILGSKGGEKIESSKNAAGERMYKIGN